MSKKQRDWKIDIVNKFAHKMNIASNNPNSMLNCQRGVVVSWWPFFQYIVTLGCGLCGISNTLGFCLNLTSFYSEWGLTDLNGLRYRRCRNTIYGGLYEEQQQDSPESSTPRSLPIWIQTEYWRSVTLRKSRQIKKAQQSWFFSLRTAGGGERDSGIENSHTMRISPKDALVLNEEAVKTEERRVFLKRIQRREEG